MRSEHALRIALVIALAVPAGLWAAGHGAALTAPATWVGLAAAIIGVFGVWWRANQSLLIQRREVEGLAASYGQGDFSRALREDGQDEFGAGALALDRIIHVLQARMLALERDRARLETILRGMVEGVLVVNDEGRLVLANEAATRLLRLAEPALLGRRYLEIIRHPDVATQVGQALEGLSPGGIELTLGTHGPTIVARAAPVRAGRGSGAVLVLHDITDLRRADRMRRDFVANVSHELRTPLTAIRGYVEALLDSEPGGDPRPFLQIIFRQATRMERLVQDLLRLARLDARQETLDTTTVHIERLFGTVLGDLAPSLDARRQRVLITVTPDAATVAADPAKLHDIIRNLAENASNYSPEGTEIELGARRQDETVLLTVADRGPGIPESDLSRIFERFYRVDKARSRETGGTGLGLSIVRHLVELHGGEVAAHNRDGGGAVFTVSLPDNPVPM